jgi:glucuronoarabinoxylan endo-1,4-beta-xylanase
VAAGFHHLYLLLAAKAVPPGLAEALFWPEIARIWRLSDSMHKFSNVELSDCFKIGLTSRSHFTIFKALIIGIFALGLSACGSGFSSATASNGSSSQINTATRSPTPTPAPTPTPTASPSRPVTTIDWTTTYQTIDGFGGSNVASHNWDNAYDTFFFHTLGLSLLRVDVPNDGSCTSVNRSCAQNESSSTIDMQACVANGCKVWATSWSPPAAYTTSGDVNCGDTGYSTLSSNSYRAYATYLSNYIASLRRYYGVTLYAISPQNEPTVCTSYPSSLWSDRLFDTFIANYLGPTLQANGQSSTMIALPDASAFSNGNFTNYADTCMNDPVCAAYAKVNSFHGYWDYTGISNLYGARHFWETEVAGGSGGGGPDAPGCTRGKWCPGINDAIYWAGIIDYNIAVAGENAWLVWWLAVRDPGASALIDASTGAITTRAYVIGNYAKYIRPGFVRIDATHAPQNGVTVSAYKDSSTGAFAIVTTNQNTSSVNQTFTFSGVNPSSVTPTITSATQRLQDLSRVAISGGSFNYTLPAQSVITFHYP